MCAAMPMLRILVRSRAMLVPSSPLCSGPPTTGQADRRTQNPRKPFRGNRQLNISLATTGSRESGSRPLRVSVLTVLVEGTGELGLSPTTSPLHRLDADRAGGAGRHEPLVWLDLHGISLSEDALDIVLYVNRGHKVCRKADYPGALFAAPRRPSLGAGTATSSEVIGEDAPLQPDDKSPASRSYVQIT